MTYKYIICSFFVYRRAMLLHCYFWNLLWIFFISFEHLLYCILIIGVIYKYFRYERKFKLFCNIHLLQNLSMHTMLFHGEIRIHKQLCTLYLCILALCKNIFIFLKINLKILIMIFFVQYLVNNKNS